MVEKYLHKKGEYSLTDLLQDLKRSPDICKAGAIALFIGVVRGFSSDGSKVKGLVMEAYEEAANRILREIRRDLMSREGIVDVQIHHLLGEFNVGEDLVYVAVAGGHRDQVFPVLREAVERYKREATIFKKEITIDSLGKEKSYWVSEKNP